MTAIDFIEKFRTYGVGRRNIVDDIFINDKPPPRLGIYDLDDENLCHELVKTTCNIPHCNFLAESLLEYEDHYNSAHRYSCGQCKKILPSPHLLDLHLQETHDSFFAVMAVKKPSFCCYIEECKEKFISTDERHTHCVKIHNLPKDFRFDENLKSQKKGFKIKATSMDVDIQNTKQKGKKVVLFNNKQKTFPKYTGKKFTSNDGGKPKMNADQMDITVNDLQDSLPQMKT